jgi:hypothetical protein
METKQYVTFEIKKDDCLFSFHMPLGATWGQAIDAAFEFLQEAHKLAAKSAENMKPKEVE